MIKTFNKANKLCNKKIATVASVTQSNTPNIKAMLVAKNKITYFALLPTNFLKEWSSF